MFEEPAFADQPGRQVATHKLLALRRLGGTHVSNLHLNRTW
jgi:hypothetical protein